MKKHIKHHSITVVAVLAVLAAGAGAFVYSGTYNLGADDPHTRPVFAMMQTLRDRSIHAHSADIKVPNLDDPQLILKGAGQYAAMCTDCHLTPGMTDSEIRPGLYPQPPNLSQVRFDPKDEFWVIKHGLKMSAMPAWGLSHDDETIWSMVAFLQKLPNLTPAQYKDIVARAPPDEDMKMPMGMPSGDEGEGHSHAHSGGAETESRPAGDTKDVPMSTGAADGHAATDAPLFLVGFKPKAIPAAEAVSQAFHAALHSGDRNAVLKLLDSNISMTEAGKTQTREAYAAGHLNEDIAFMKGAHITPVSVGSMAMGDSAMVGSETVLVANPASGKPTAWRSRELLTLKKHGENWKIASIQWQSLAENTAL